MDFTMATPNGTLGLYLQDKYDPVISDEFNRLFRTVNHSLICQVVDVFGSVVNVINMVVFVKLGFSDTINLSLFALSLSDFGACFALIWINICTIPWFQELDLPFDPNQIQYLTSSWPHVLFTRITTLITGFIAIERCLCVTLPLKVKSVITRRRVTILLVGSYLLVLGSAVPIYYSSRYAWKFYEKLNKSLIGLVFTDNRHDIEAVLGPVQTIFFNIFPFVFVGVCTGILVVSLKKKALWREKATAVSKSKELSTKEQRVAKMVIIISTLFLVCFLPGMILHMVVMSHEDVSITGREKNVMMTFGSLVFTLESINSSLNIFVYYYCSTNYRDMFKEIFRLARKDSKK